MMKLYEIQDYKDIYHNYKRVLYVYKYEEGGGGTWDDPYINIIDTDWKEQTNGCVLYDNILGKPKIEMVDGQTVHFLYTDLSTTNRYDTSNGFIDINYIPFKNDEDFIFNTTFLLNPSQNTFSSTFVILFSCITFEVDSNSTLVKSGFELRLVKSGSSYSIALYYTINNSTLSNKKLYSSVTSTVASRYDVVITKTGSNISLIATKGGSTKATATYTISDPNLGKYPMIIGARLGSNGTYGYNSVIKIEQFEFKVN